MGWVTKHTHFWKCRFSANLLSFLKVDIDTSSTPARFSLCPYHLLTKQVHLFENCPNLTHMPQYFYSFSGFYLRYFDYSQRHIITSSMFTFLQVEFHDKSTCIRKSRRGRWSVYIPSGFPQDLQKKFPDFSLTFCHFSLTI